MSLFSRGRTTRRAAAVVTVAVTSLVGASSVNAALGGGKQAAFPNRPNLVSVTVNQTISTTTASYTFDKPVDLTAPAPLNAFQLYGYSALNGPAADDLLNTSAPVRTGNTVTVTVAGTPDPDEIAVGTVAANTVNSTTAGSGVAQQNIADGTRVTGALGEAGTRGHTVAPDLVSVRNSGSNTLTYVFDEELKAPITTNGFTVIGADGTPTPSTNATISGNEAVVTFPPATNVNGSRQAAVLAGSVRNAFGNIGVAGSADITGQSTTSEGPVLQSAEVVSANQIRYTYASTVATNGTSNTGFLAVLSDASSTPSTSAIVNGNTVLATFPNFDAYREFLVAAAANPGAISSQTAVVSQAGGKPVGGNAGAKASGYTSGPDAVAAAFGGNSVTVIVDSRVSAVGAAGTYTLLNKQGEPSGGTATAVNATLNGAPGPTAIAVTFNSATAVTEAGAIVLAQGAAAGTDPIPNQNIQQTVGR